MDSLNAQGTSLRDSLSSIISSWHTGSDSRGYSAALFSNRLRKAINQWWYTGSTTSAAAVSGTNAIAGTITGLMNMLKKNMNWIVLLTSCKARQSVHPSPQLWDWMTYLRLVSLSEIMEWTLFTCLLIRALAILNTLWHKPNWEAVWNPMCAPHWFAFRRTVIKGSSFVDVEQLLHFTTWQLCYFSNGSLPPQWPMKARNDWHSESFFLKIPGQMVIYNVKRYLIQH